MFHSVVISIFIIVNVLMFFGSKDSQELQKYRMQKTQKIVSSNITGE